MPTCIYCRETTPGEKYKRREHVIPQAFGLFEQNLVLWKEVCENCNKTLGREVETPGTRSSVEGIHRFHHAKLMGRDSFLKISKKAVRWEPEEPGWETLKTHFEPTEDGDVEVRYLPQVTVKFEDGRCKTFFPEDITDAKQFEGVKTYRAHIISLQDREVIVEALKRVGIEPTWGPIQDLPNNGKDTVSMTAYITFDDITRRLAAKIAFNYLASKMPASFMLKDEFNAVRRFIRYGDGQGERFVARQDEPFLREEMGAGGWYLTDDHLVGVSHSAADGLIGDVSIFNLNHYRIALTRTNPEVVHSGLIPSGHQFSWRTKKIRQILAWSDHNVVQPFEVIAEQVRRGKRRR